MHSSVVQDFSDVCLPWALPLFCEHASRDRWQESIVVCVRWNSATNGLQLV